MFYALLDIITIGLPFSLFKAAAGFYYEQNWLLWLGIIDLIINAFNMVVILIKKKKVFPTCLLAILFNFIGRKSEKRWDDFGESLDVLLSFSLVALIIGSGAIAGFPDELLNGWNMAVVLNVLGAGSARVFISLKRLKSAPE